MKNFMDKALIILLAAAGIILFIFILWVMIHLPIM